MKSMKTARPPSCKFRRILVPVDFSDHSRQAFRTAIALARQFGLSLAVIHVTRRNRPDSHIVAELTGMAFDPHPAGRTLLAQFVEREAPGDFQLKRIVADGVPHVAIAKAATAWRGDLIVISTHGYTGLKHVLMGSTAECVVRHAPCQMLVVR